MGITNKHCKLTYRLLLACKCSGPTKHISQLGITSKSVSMTLASLYIDCKRGGGEIPTAAINYLYVVTQFLISALLRTRRR